MFQFFFPFIDLGFSEWVHSEGMLFFIVILAWVHSEDRLLEVLSSTRWQNPFLLWKYNVCFGFVFFSSLDYATEFFFCHPDQTDMGFILESNFIKNPEFFGLNLGKTWNLKFHKTIYF